MSDEALVKDDHKLRFQPPKVAGHRFVDSSEGWACEVCNRRWADVVARQPTWPKHSREDGAQVSQGIACVGTLNTPEEEQIEAEKARVWDAVREAAAS